MSSTTDPADAEEAPPWRPEDGPAPIVTTWPRAARPALKIRVKGTWRYASVTARQEWANGRVAYQVELDADGSTAVTQRTFWWGQPGVRFAHGSPVQASAKVDENAQGGHAHPQPAPLISRRCEATAGGRGFPALRPR